MGFMDSFERGLERAVNGAFARTFKSGVQPVEIAAGLKRELDIHSVVVDRDRVLTANQFTVRVSAADAERLDNYGDTLTDELESLAQTYANEQGYQFLGPVSVVVTADDAVTTGVLEIDAAKPSHQTAWGAALEIDGKRYPLQRGRTVVGRGSGSDIRVTDTAASRQHLEILWDGRSGLARDLGSTNGTKVDGQRFQELGLQQGTTMTIGQTAIRFKLVPQDGGRS